MTYLEQCTKYFAPIDEINEALTNGENCCGISNEELVVMVVNNSEMAKDIEIYG